MTANSRDREIQRFFDEMEAAPKGRELRGPIRATVFADEVDASGKVTMRDLCGFGVVSRKTILKHIAAGELVGRKIRVAGVETWMFEPEHAQAYLKRAADLNLQSVHNRPGRPVRYEPPVGFLDIRGVAEASGLSKWTVYDAVADGRLPVAEIGPHGVKLIATADAEAFSERMAGKGRGPQRREKVVRPTSRERRPFVVSNRMLLLWLVLDQPGETNAALARDLDVGTETVRRWARGQTEPDDLNTAKIVAYARGRYAIRVSAELADIAKRHRKDYMVEYMRDRRAGTTRVSTAEPAAES